jgi:hypothetical protein
MIGHQWLQVLTGIAVALLLTWLLLIAALATGRPRGKMLQLSAAYRRFSPSGTQPDPNRRLRPKMVVLAVLVVLNVVWLGLLLSRAPGEQAVESTSIQNATPAGQPSSTGTSPGSDPSEDWAAEEPIQLADLAASARPFESVRIQGTYRAGAETLLRVQRWERGTWLDFPLPMKTDQLGQFTTYVELGRPGLYWLRVVDPGSAVTSIPFLLVIEG